MILTLIQIRHTSVTKSSSTRADILHWRSVKSGLAGVPCTFCSEFGMMMDHDGRQSLTLDEFIQ